jgi:hypothetical protein
MVDASGSVEFDRAPLTIVDGTTNAQHSASDPNSTSRVKLERSRPPTQVSTKGVEIDKSDTGSAATKDLRAAKDLKDDKKALAVFRSILTGLVSDSEGNDKTTCENEPPKLSRNPFVRIRRYLEQEPEFEEMVGKYASLLTVLEQPAGLAYSQTALVGIEALRTRRLGIARTVFDEVRYRTSSSAALVSVMKGVGRFVLILLTLIIAVPSGWLAILHAFGVSREMIVYPFSNQTGQHIGVAILFGCLGSVVSLLLRLAEFESTRGRSKEFLLFYSSTLPIVGGVFAAVFSVLLDAKVISALGDGISVYVLVGFLSGFSERFTRNLLSIAENSLSASKPARERTWSPSVNK